MSGLVRITIETPTNILPQLADRFDAAAAGAMNDALRDLETVARAVTPVRTGFLVGSIQLHLAGGLGDEASLDWTAYYAGYVNDGTRYMEGRHYAERAAASAPNTVEAHFIARWGA